MTVKTLPEKIQGLRKQIDNCDEFLIKMLSYRFKIVAEVSALKKSGGIPPLDSARFNEIKNKSRKLALAENIDPTLIDRVFDVIHEYSVDSQSRE